MTIVNRLVKNKLEHILTDVIYDGSEWEGDEHEEDLKHTTETYAKALLERLREL